MKNSHVQLALLLICSLTVDAQSWQKEEFILTLNKDTVAGKVVVNNKGNRTVTSIEFTPKAGTTTENLDASEITGFYDDIWGLFSTHTIASADNEQKQMFLEVLVAGRMSLLVYHGRTKFFLQRKGNAPEELIEVKEERIIAGRALRLTDSKYKKLLKVYMEGCKVDIDKVKLLEEDLKDLFIQYNKICADNQLQHVAKIDKGKFDVTALAGVAFSSVPSTTQKAVTSVR